MTRVLGNSLIRRHSQILSRNIHPEIVLCEWGWSPATHTKKKVQRITVLYLKKPLAPASPIDSSRHQLELCSLFQCYSFKCRDGAAGLKGGQAFSTLAFHKRRSDVHVQVWLLTADFFWEAYKQQPGSLSLFVSLLCCFSMDSTSWTLESWLGLASFRPTVPGGR